MKVKKALAFISTATRSSDWRLSFVPFIMACVYLWSSLFAIRFSLSTLYIFALSVCTTFGFAALGYFINEFFDKKDDSAAGKINKLSLISWKLQVLLFLAILCACFLPWLSLPKNEITLYLILTELGCFLLYSLPFIRLKRSAYFAGIIDAMYAYLIPALLAFHTYSLLTKNVLEITPILFFVAIFFIGYRNIFLHQIKDVLGDQKSGIISLPKQLGVRQSYFLLKLLYFLELSLLLAFSIELVYINKIYLPWLLMALCYLFYVKTDLVKIFKDGSYVALLPVRHVLDLLYQLWFPLIQLVILIWMDWRWIVLVPFHLFLFVNKDYLIEFLMLSRAYLWYKTIRPLLSVMINYPIYILFRLFGVDLKKEKKSALSFIKNKFS